LFRRATSGHVRVTRLFFMKSALFFFLSLLLAMSSSVSSSAATPAVTSAPFGRLADGRAATVYTLTNAQGMRADITDYGAIVVRLSAPDRQGRQEDVVLGFNRVEDYVKASPYFGAVVGRYGNRIAGGRFTLDGQTFTLATNNSPGGIPCHLHGGQVGFDKVLWRAEPQLRDNVAGLELTCLSRDGEEGYPGNLEVTVRYRLTNDNALHVEYSAVTDRPTPVNLTQHTYFNLKGEGRGDINGHVLTLRARRMTPVNAGLIPTGEIRDVGGTPFDFTTPHAIGARLDADDAQLRFGGGYDHNWVLDRGAEGLALAAEVFEPDSGRVLQVWTEEPGLQFYGGNFLDGSYVGKGGRPYVYRGGFCLETQHFPDSPNQPAFPPTILRPGETYRSATVFRFAVR
jgi:aldose 1-epimerase